jgi:hypothetical protein
MLVLRGCSRHRFTVHPSNQASGAPFSALASTSGKPSTARSSPFSSTYPNRAESMSTMSARVRTGLIQDRFRWPEFLATGAMQRDNWCRTWLLSRWRLGRCSLGATTGCLLSWTHQRNSTYVYLLEKNKFRLSSLFQCLF